MGKNRGCAGIFFKKIRFYKRFTVRGVEHLQTGKVGFEREDAAHLLNNLAHSGNFPIFADQQSERGSDYSEKDDKYQKYTAGWSSW